MTHIRKQRSALLVALLLSAGIGFAGVAGGADSSSSSGASAGAGASSGAGNAGASASDAGTAGMGGSAAGMGDTSAGASAAGTGASSGVGGSAGASPGATGAGGSNAAGTLPPPGATTVPPATGMRTPSTTPGAAASASDTPSMAFRKLDQGAKGYVTVDDASAIPGFGKAFQDNDADHDGKLSAQEFSRAWEQFSGR